MATVNGGVGIECQDWPTKLLINGKWVDQRIGKDFSDD